MDAFENPPVPNANLQNAFGSEVHHCQIRFLGLEKPRQLPSPRAECAYLK